MRAFRAVGGSPPFIASGKGSRVTDADGRTYLDFVSSWGPLILGHADDEIVAAIAEAAARGTSFGAPTEAEIELGRLIVSAMPSIERLRFVSSGTEATMSALRVARAFTGRTKVLKFDGGYHGHSDGLLVAAGSGALTLGVPSSAGVPASWTAETLSVPYNDVAAVAAAFSNFPDQIAAVIVEPVAGNMGVVPPAIGFLERLRSLCGENGTVLVFDEVITGFRVAPGGAQELFGITPDLTCLGKIIGGGLPVGAFGGRAEIMTLLAPEGPVYQAGTLSGNPVTMAAGAATLRRLRDPVCYQKLEALGERMATALLAAASAAEVPLRVQRIASMLTPFFCPDEVVDEGSARSSDTRAYARFHSALLDRGIYAPPSQYEAWFLSLAHTDEDLDAASIAIAGALGGVSTGR